MLRWPKVRTQKPAGHSPSGLAVDGRRQLGGAPRPTGQHGMESAVGLPAEPPEQFGHGAWEQGADIHPPQCMPKGCTVNRRAAHCRVVKK